MLEAQEGRPGTEEWSDGKGGRRHRAEPCVVPSFVVAPRARAPSDVS